MTKLELLNLPAFKKAKDDAEIWITTPGISEFIPTDAWVLPFADGRQNLIIQTQEPEETWLCALLAAKRLNKMNLGVCFYGNLFPYTHEWDDSGYPFALVREKQMDVLLKSHGCNGLDEKFVHGLIRGLTAMRDIFGRTTFSSDNLDITETINWLKSLRPQPQKVYEQTVRGILAMCDSYEKNGIFADDRARDFLGNVRVKCKDAIDCAPILDEPHWKPSEEQIGALNYAYCELFKREDVGHNILGPLQSLIDTLRKL